MPIITGSSKNERGFHAIEIRHLIEYISLDLENRVAELTANFMGHNSSDNPSQLYIGCMGNVDFEVATKGWTKDEKNTRILEGVAGRFIGIIKKGNKPYLERCAEPPLKLEVISNPQIQYEKLRLNDPSQKAKFFTMATVELKPNGFHPDNGFLLRLHTKIEGDDYRVFMPQTYKDILSANGRDYHFRDIVSQAEILIMGGEPYFKSIISRLDKNTPQRQKFEEAFGNYFFPPWYHHFFVGDFEDLDIYHYTGDIIKKVLIQTEYGEIFWMCSDSDLNTYSRRGGIEIALKKIKDEVLVPRQEPRDDDPSDYLAMHEPQEVPSETEDRVLVLT